MTGRKLKIAIFTSGRYYIMDLARELCHLGHDVAFYSYVPPWRTKKFGLPSEANRCFLPWVSHRLAALRTLRNTRHAIWAEQKLIESVDRIGTKILEPCDVFIGMSGLCNRTAEIARQKYKAKVWIDRGSRHINSQKEILDKLPGLDKVTDFTVKRELKDYELADTVAVLSKHCEQSFLDQGFPKHKLVRNPMGVDLTMFKPTPVPDKNIPPTIIMAGTWSYRKGCDLLVEAWKKLPGTRLMHLGKPAGAPIPDMPGFMACGMIDQTRLPEFYSQGHVMALASREEGLATVQPQALASGLRLVCTDRTGGEDLAEHIPEPNVVRVVPSDDLPGFTNALKLSLDDCQKESGIRDRFGSARDQFSWQAYGKRYEQNLLARL